VRQPIINSAEPPTSNKANEPGSGVNVLAPLIVTEPLSTVADEVMSVSVESSKVMLCSVNQHLSIFSEPKLRSNAGMPNYIRLKVKTTGSVAGGKTLIVDLASQAEVDQQIVAARNELGDDLAGFELTYPDGRHKSLTADGKEEL